MISSKFNRVPKSKGNKDDQEFRWHLISLFSLSNWSVFFLAELNLRISNNCTKIRLISYSFLYFGSERE